MAELIFNFLKKVANRPGSRQLAKNNLDAAFYGALASITPLKMYGIYWSMPYFQF